MQVIGLIGQIGLVALLTLLALAFGYAIGHTDGVKEGFDRGRAIGRHAAGREVGK